MPKEIKQKITLSGEKEYNQALKEAKRNLKTLQSEFKAETAELGKNASAQQKAEVKTKSLQKQIKEQEKIVKTLKEALDQAKKEYGDNADVVQKWERQLNDSRTTLANMKSGLEDVSKGFRDIKNESSMATVATKSVADSLGSISNVAQSISNSIEGIFTGMVSTIRDSISLVWDDMMELASRANDWEDLAFFWNTSAANIQKWYHAVNGSHNDFSQLTSLMMRINTGDSKKIAAASGVSAEGYEDKWEYGLAVMDALSQMPYEEMLTAAGEIFGSKRAEGVVDFLGDWSKIRQNLGRFDVENGGIGMTDEQIEDMSTLAEKVSLIEQTWAAFIDSFEASHFAKLALNLTGNAQAILDALIEFMEAKTPAERQAALDKFKDNIVQFFTRIGEAMTAAAETLEEIGTEFEGSENGVLRLMGKALNAFSDVLEFLASEDGIDKVIDGFETLLAFWAGAEVLQFLTGVSQLAANLKTIGGFNFAGAAAGGGGFLGVLSEIAGVLVLLYPLIHKLVRGWEAPDDWLSAAGIGIYGNAGGTNTTRNKIAQAVLDMEEDQLDIPMPGEGGFSLTAGQRSAAEKYWDVLRNGDLENFDSAYTAMQMAFAGDSDTFEKLDTMMDELLLMLDKDNNTPGANIDDFMDLPASWWTNTGNSATGGDGITNENLSKFNSLPGDIEKAVARSISGIHVTMDGVAVGRLVASTVSQIIALNTTLV